VTTPAMTQQYNLGPVKPWVQNAGDLLGPQFGIKTEYGWRKTDPFPDHPTGHAIDFMTPTKAAGDALATYAVSNYQALGIKYVIWYRQYWSPTTGWVPYTATTNPHTDHVHITFLDQPGTWTTTAGYIPVSDASLTAAVSDTCAWNINLPSIAGIGGGNICILSKPQVRGLLGGILIGGGATIAALGIILLMVYGLKQTGLKSVLPKGLG
jgi:hypothetical protein